MSIDMENLMPIGEFASASRLSQKALRLYGEKGLLTPAWVDPDSGYRYYVAFTEISGRKCQFPEILGAYDAVYRWAKDNGREPGGPAREIYLSGPGADERLQIAVPLR